MVLCRIMRLVVHRCNCPARWLVGVLLWLLQWNSCDSVRLSLRSTLQQLQSERGSEGVAQRNLRMRAHRHVALFDIQAKLAVKAKLAAKWLKVTVTVRQTH